MSAKDALKDEILKKAVLDHIPVANIFHNAGYTYNGLGNYTKALECFEKADEIYKHTLQEKT